MQHEELAALEWVMQVHMSARPNVGMMMCGQVRPAVPFAEICLAYRHYIIVPAAEMTCAENISCFLSRCQFTTVVA